jgi:hypothetical protein
MEKKKISADDRKIQWVTAQWELYKDEHEVTRTSGEIMKDFLKHLVLPTIHRPAEYSTYSGGDQTINRGQHGTSNDVPVSPRNTQVGEYQGQILRKQTPARARTSERNWCLTTHNSFKKPLIQ